MSKQSVFMSLWAMGAFVIPALGLAQTPPSIHVVYMGGNDCPPCVAWRQEELPKLQATDVFKRVQFTRVEKVIRSTVPPRLFLPSAVKPLKEKLDAAANNITGSPQTAVFVNGDVYDYYFASRSAADIEKMLLAIERGEPYPFPRCLKRQSQRECAVPGP